MHNGFRQAAEDTEKKATAIKAAGKRKVSASEACRLFKAFDAAQAKMLKFATDNATWCGIPPQVIDKIKAGIAKTPRSAPACASWRQRRRVRPALA